MAKHPPTQLLEQIRADLDGAAQPWPEWKRLSERVASARFDLHEIKHVGYVWAEQGAERGLLLQWLREQRKARWCSYATALHAP